MRLPSSLSRPLRSPSAEHAPRAVRPTAAYRQRTPSRAGEAFQAPETWHEPVGRTDIHYVVEPAGEGFVHPVSVEQIRERLALLPAIFRDTVEVIQLSPMTRKRRLFPCYGMQWGPNVYLYPIEESLEEIYTRQPTPQQQIEARMYGGVWRQDGALWRLCWTQSAIEDFYLNNVLIHEVGHVNDTRNTNAHKREQYANWFATEYGFRASRGRRS